MTASDLSTLPPIVGLDAVGRGVYIRPRQAYSLRSVLFPRADFTPYASRESGTTYRIPAGYAVNDSPPVPGGRALNQVTIEESWGRFDQRVNLDVKVSAGMGPVTVDASAGRLTSLRQEEEAYYAIRTSCVPLWTVYLPDMTRLPPDTFDLEVPTPFSHAHRRAYDRFFERFGTHVVRRAWVGGQANLVYSVTKSSGVSKEDIQAALSTSFGASSSAQSQQSRERLLSNANCTVLGKGGDELALAAMSSLDEARYNEWLASVKQNPQIIEIEAVGIWELVEDEAVADALEEAWHEANTFSPISAVFHLDGKIWFLRGDDYFTYDLDSAKSTRPKPIVELWPGLKGTGFERADAAFLDRSGPTPLVHLFRRDKLAIFDPSKEQILPGYPKPFAEAMPGLTFERIDAALTIDARTAYFFCGQRYIRYDLERDCADDGYPDAVPARWQGLHYDRIDAAIYWGNAKIYFFIGDQYVRYDIVTCRVDPGYPRYLVGRYVEDWRFFD